jgi:hypothetical protein
MALQKVPFLPDTRETVRRLVDTANRAMDGRSNAIGEVTLTPSATTTAVTDYRVGSDSVIVLMQTTANAAAAYGTTYVSARTQGGFTLTHANNAQTDRTFEYTVTG